MSKQTIEIDVPEGYEAINVETFDNLEDGGILHSRIIFKKKPIKDFEWYVREYFNKKFIYNFLDDTVLIGLLNDLVNDAKYDNALFEVKIGLLKFICDDNKLDCQQFISAIHMIDGLKLITEFNKVIDILPEGFLKSIFEK